MRLHDGDQVTIVPADGDPVLWHMQRHVHVDHRGDDGYWVRFTDARPPVQGPVPEGQLLVGWVHR